MCRRRFLGFRGRHAAAGKQTPRRVWRLVVLGLLAGIFTMTGAVPASAAPVTDLNTIPSELRKYIPQSPQFSQAPWMTSPTCQGKGGDFSLWVTSVIQDTPLLLSTFQSSKFGPEMLPEDKPRNEMILAGFRKLAPELQAAVPPAYCVDDFKRWAGPDITKPFGFPWGVTWGQQRTTGYFCTDRADPNTTEDIEANRYFGAERAPCNAFYVSCANAPENEKPRCEAWNAFSDRYVSRVRAMRGEAIDKHPATGVADTLTEVKSPGEVVGDVIGGWFEELTKTIAEGSARMMAEAMTWWTRTDNSSMLESGAITEIQGMLKYVGIALLAGSMIWQGMLLLLRRKIDPLMTVGKGLLSYVGWSTLGGSVAILIYQAGNDLTNQVLDKSIDDFSKSIGDSLVGQAPGATAIIFFLSIIVFFLACIQWVLGFFRMGAVVILLALLPTAAAGQMTERTKPWLPKVLGWGFALEAYQPVSGVAFALGFELQAQGRNLATVLVGITVLMLAVISMPTMLRFFSWGGQQLVNSGGGGGGVMAVGAAASVLGGGSLSRFMSHQGPASGKDTESGGPARGALPVSPAHAGNDGPGAGGGAGRMGPGGGGNGQPGGQLTSATGGMGQPGGALAGAGNSAVLGRAGLAAAGPVGALAAGAQVAGAVANAAVKAPAGAMTDGADGRGGK